MPHLHNWLYDVLKKRNGNFFNLFNPLLVFNCPLLVSSKFISFSLYKCIEINGFSIHNLYHNVVNNVFSNLFHILLVVYDTETVYDIFNVNSLSSIIFNTISSFVVILSFVNTVYQIDSITSFWVITSAIYFF